MSASRDPGRILILGAGPTGLGCAWRLREAGYRDYDVLEAGDGPGGLATSVVDGHGFTWDMGGHVQFSHYRTYDEVLDRALGEAWLWHERESWIWIRNRFVPYPFQYNIQRLDPFERDRALAGLEAAAARVEAERPPHFKAWLRRTFGEGLTDIFMFPYNEKVWGFPLEELDWSWIGERVAVPDVERVKRNIAGNRDDVSWGPNNQFRFPEFGGTGAIWSAVAGLLDADRLRYGRRAAAIDTAARTVAFDDGQVLPYDTLISTMPLDRCVAMAAGLDADVQPAGRRLTHSAVHVLGIGLRGGKPAALGQKCWMYFPEANSPYYRVTVFSHYSPNHVPAGDGTWSLMAEVCETPHRPVDADALESWTRRALLEDGLIEPGAEIVSFWRRRLEYGYPTPFLGRDAVLARIQPELARHGIYSRGRFGGWKYEVANQDHCFMQGVELVNRLLDGAPEVTYTDPATANSGVFLKP